MTTALAKQDEGFFSEEQQKIIRDSFLSGASASEAAMLLEVSKAMRLNPIKRQIFFVKRYDSQKRTEVWAFQVSIDGLRAIAERTGQYDGQDEPEFEEGTNGTPKVARVRVWRKGISRPFVGVAYWDEYVQKKADGSVTHMWGKFKHIMLSKCAEALALRKAFPEELAGAYVPEEMAQDKEAEATPPKRGLEAIPSAKAAVVEAPRALPSDVTLSLEAKKAKADTMRDALAKKPDARNAKQARAKLAELEAEIAAEEAPSPPPPNDADWVPSEPPSDLVLPGQADTGARG